MYARIGRCYINNSIGITDNTIFIKPDNNIYNECSKEPDVYSVQPDLQGHISLTDNKKDCIRYNSEDTENNYSYKFERISSTIQDAYKHRRDEQKKQMQQQQQQQQQQHQNQQQEQQQQLMLRRNNVYNL